ncbi:hypothetical protein [Streptomyces luteireticuli]|uniref:hypothetical protein n=1 Tax=Streptomyces luteireticuli TaxID=173858 RepID=UPI003557FB17
MSSPHPTPQQDQGPDYTDESLGIVYTWIRRRDGKDPRFGIQLVNQMATALDTYAQERGARLIGQPDFDFPDPNTLPREVRHEVARILAREEPRWWRRPFRVLVRVWQDTEPAGTPQPAREAKGLA